MMEPITAVLLAMPLLQAFGCALGIELARPNQLPKDFGVVKPSKGGGIKIDPECSCSACQAQREKYEEV